MNSKKDGAMLIGGVLFKVKTGFTQMKLKGKAESWSFVTH